MESLKSKKFNKLEEQKLNDLINVTGGYGFEQTAKLEYTGALTAPDRVGDLTHIGKGSSGVTP